MTLLYCGCKVGYAWNSVTNSCLPALAFAVGVDRADLFHTKALVLAWNGVQWTRQRVPPELTSSSSASLTSVGIVDAHTAFAGGRWISNKTTNPMGVIPKSIMLQLNNDSTWTTVPGMGAMPMPTPLVAAAPVARKAWMLGGTSPPGARVYDADAQQWLDSLHDGWGAEAMSASADGKEVWAARPRDVLRWSATTNDSQFLGGQWTSVATNGNGQHFKSVGVADASNVWASAQDWANASAEYGQFNKWDPNAGRFVKQSMEADPANILYHEFPSIVAVDGATAWAVGSCCTTPKTNMSIAIVYRYNITSAEWYMDFDGGVHNYTDSPLFPLYGASAWSKDAAVAVGYGGTVVWWDGMKWTHVPGLGMLSSYDLNSVALWAPT